MTSSWHQCITTEPSWTSGHLLLRHLNCRHQNSIYNKRYSYTSTLFHSPIQYYIRTVKKCIRRSCVCACVFNIESRRPKVVLTNEVQNYDEIEPCANWSTSWQGVQFVMTSTNRHMVQLDHILNFVEFGLINSQQPCAWNMLHYYTRDRFNGTDRLVSSKPQF